MNIIIKKHFLLYKGYKLKCSIGKSGITKSKKEGDFATPKGIFKLGLLYYRKDRNKSFVSKIKKRIIKKKFGIILQKVKLIQLKHTYIDLEKKF